MYSREDSKNIREKFWNGFKSWSGRKRTRLGKPGRWMMNDTGMRQVRLKFHFDENTALAGIEIDTKNLDKRIELWEKFESLKNLFVEKCPFESAWELEYPLTDNKTVSRIYDQLLNVSIYNPECWKQVNDFLYSRMLFFEDFFTEYRDFLKYGKI